MKLKPNTNKNKNIWHPDCPEDVMLIEIYNRNEVAETHYMCGWAKTALDSGSPARWRLTSPAAVAQAFHLAPFLLDSHT